MGQQKRERKLTSPNTLLAVCRSKGPKKSREELAAQASDWPSPAGGLKQGEGERGRLGPKDCIPYRTANRPPVSNQRPSEILQGGLRGDTGHRHPTRAGIDWGWGYGREKAHAPHGRGWKLRLGPRRREGAMNPGRVHPSSSWLPEPL